MSTLAPEDMTLPEGTARYLVGLATRAPSLHNTQPWWFRPSGDAIDVLPDPSRTLPITDPSGWGTRIAIGAAGFNLRLGYAALGWEAHAVPMPGSAPLDPILRVRPVRLRPATPAEQDLLRAVPRRHTNRRGYFDQVVPNNTLVDLSTAAKEESAWLRVLDPRQAEELAQLIAAADDVLEQRPGYLEERMSWSRVSSWDGVRPDPFAGAHGPGERLRRRDFGSPTTANRPEESDPCLAVLGSWGATAYDDLKAGGALQRVLLTATEQGLSTAMYSQPIEVPQVRAQLDRLCGLGTSHMVLRFGYGPAHAPSARRPVDDVLLDAIATEK